MSIDVLMQLLTVVRIYQARLSGNSELEIGSCTLWTVIDLLRFDRKSTVARDSLHSTSTCF